MSSTFRFAFAALALWATFAPPGSAGAAAFGDALCEVRAEALAGFQERIATAPDADAARALAFDETAGARHALDRAAWFAGEQTVERGRERLDAIDARVAAAATPGEVALAFGAAEPLAAGAVATPLADISGRCSFTNEEVIVIVIGLIFGIIPGLIFIFLFC